MTITATHPPSSQRVSHYRRAGYWQEPASAVDHRRRLAAGTDRIAVVDDRSAWTYTELASAANNIGAALADAGVRAGDAVLVIAPLRNAAAAAVLAVLHSGAVAVLLDRRCGRADVTHAAAAAHPTVALAFTDDADRLDLRRHCPVLALEHTATHTAEQPPALNEGLLDPDAPALVVFTSGTTSSPKGVIHTLNSLRCGAANMAAALKFTAADAFFLPSPLASITGVLQLRTALQSHARIILTDRFAAQSSLEHLCRHRATVFGGTPVIAEQLFAEADRQRRIDLPLRCIALGGSMIAPAVLDGARRFGIQPVRVYGSSEAPFSTATALDEDAVTADDGAPLPGVDVALGTPGAAGELIIQGPHQFHGYLDPTHNADAFCAGWVRTGDLVDIAEGRIRITGRLKDIASRKGMKISLAEIDATAAGLGDCAAYTLPDADTGERVALAVYTTAATPVTYERVVEHLSAAGLAKYKLPEQIVVWDQPLPRNETGKIIRRRLTKPGEHHHTVYAPRLAHHLRPDEEH